MNLNCWNSTEEVTKWMTENGRGLTKDDFIDVWGEFQEKGIYNTKGVSLRSR